MPQLASRQSPIIAAETDKTHTLSLTALSF